MTGFDENGAENGTSSIEYDLYVGYADSLGPIDYDFSLVYYWFPNDNGNLEADVLEFWVGLSHTFAEVKLSPTIGLLTVYSPDATLEDGDYIYVKSSLELVLTETIGFDFAAGVVDVKGDKATDEGGAFCNSAADLLCDGYGYTHWELGLTKTAKGFDFDLALPRYQSTSELYGILER